MCERTPIQNYLVSVWLSCNCQRWDLLEQRFHMPLEDTSHSHHTQLIQPQLSIMASFWPARPRHTKEPQIPITQELFLTSAHPNAQDLCPTTTSSRIITHLSTHSTEMLMTPPFGCGSPSMDGAELPLRSARSPSQISPFLRSLTWCLIPDLGVIADRYHHPLPATICIALGRHHHPVVIVFLGLHPPLDLLGRSL